jgi:hypothetical protein
LYKILKGPFTLFFVEQKTKLCLTATYLAKMRHEGRFDNLLKKLEEDIGVKSLHHLLGRATKKFVAIDIK